MPPAKGTGLHTREADGSITSSWGGTVLYEEGMYHMWAAEMTRHCGIDSWTENSRIVHATSPTADGVYTRQEEVFGVFAHEPNAVRDPVTGEIVLFFTANFSDGPSRAVCNCSDGSSSAAGKCAHGGAEGATF